MMQAHRKEAELKKHKKTNSLDGHVARALPQVRRGSALSNRLEKICQHQFECNRYKMAQGIMLA